MVVTGPVLALTQGDPAGVGLDIAVPAWRALRAARPDVRVVFYGDGDALAARSPGAPLRQISDVADARTGEGDSLFVRHAPCPAPVRPGAPDPRNAGAITSAIADATADALEGRVDAVVTNPIAKSVLYAAGFRHPGHTEYLAALCKEAGAPWPALAAGPVMMLVGGGLRVALASIHAPLRHVPDLLTIPGIADALLVTAEALHRQFGCARPRIAVAGLNPHAGEDGALGTEERDLIIPAMAHARARLAAAGIECALTGPYPADTLFHAERRAGYDAVLAMYHDQGLIPVKTLDFHGGVNVTLGLPIVRTSPDHGTAFDIAGTGAGRPDSLINALLLAAEMSQSAPAAAQGAGRQ